MFAKAAVWQGALDKFAEAKAGKRGTAEVDDEFLAEIERWRELLASNLVLRNPTLRGRDVNWAVQQTIDRIVFLRICEARDLETFEQLHALLNGGRTYERLLYPRPFPVDILVRTPREIEQALKVGVFFIREIVSQGRVLYERSN